MNKEEIGTNAGMVWQALHANGAMSFDDLIETFKSRMAWCHCMYIRKSTIDAV